MFVRSGTQYVFQKGYKCSATGQRHIQLTGVDKSSGQFLTNRAEAYPPRLCNLWAKCIQVFLWLDIWPHGTVARAPTCSWVWGLRFQFLEDSPFILLQTLRADAHFCERSFRLRSSENLSLHMYWRNKYACTLILLCFTRFLDLAPN